MDEGLEPTRYCHDCAHARVRELEDLIVHLQKVSAPGARTLDDFMRDMGYINDRLRSGGEGL